MKVPLAPDTNPTPTPGDDTTPPSTGNGQTPPIPGKGDSTTGSATTPSQSTENAATGILPQTGDNTKVVMYAGLILLLVALALFAVARRKATK